MARSVMRRTWLLLGFSLNAALFSVSAYGQVVRDSATPAPQSSGAEVPAGKKRVSREVELASQASWMDTGIDVQAGERVVITATGKLRYVDAREDSGPAGLARGFKDLLRVLP